MFMKQPDLAVQNCVAERMCMGEDMDDVSLFHGYAIDGTVTDISFVVLALRSAAARQLQGTATQHVGGRCCRPPSTRDGENRSTVAAWMALHNMLRRTVDLDRESQVCGDVILSFNVTNLGIFMKQPDLETPSRLGNECAWEKS
jgi:hypothetical protein